jgi:spore germination protein KA
MSGKKTDTNIANSSDKTSVSLPLSTSLDENLARFREIFAHDELVKIRIIENSHSQRIRCGLIFIDGMVDRLIIQQGLIRPIMTFNFGELPEDISPDLLFQTIENQIINVSEVSALSDQDELVGAVLFGNSVLLMEGVAKGLVTSAQKWETRAISEPATEKVVRGSREGFTESLKINLTLLRRRMQNSDLKFVYSQVGGLSKTPTCLCYIEGLASPDILKELQNRLEQVDIDHILDTGYLAELIRDEPYSPFELIGSTERPDSVVGKLMEGRIALLIEGSPFALTLPYVFVENFQSSEDYYMNFYFASFNRMIRIVGAFLSISIPALYLALVSYSQEMLPTMLLLSIANARMAVPFPTVVEALVMLTTFEILREAGARIPTTIGQAVSIVGALVLGQAAVEARLVSAPMVIIVGVTGITSLLNPRLTGSLMVVRTLLLLSAFMLGLYGYFLGLLGLVIHLMSLRSFGVSYMLGVGAIRPQDIKDTIIRVPWWHMYMRPAIISGRNMRRYAQKKKGRKL